MKCEFMHNETELYRELYVFDFNRGHNGPRLDGIYHQKRETTRHKWKTVEKWCSMDERSYYSTLARPTCIPVEILNDVREEMIKCAKTAPIYIGFFNSGCIIDKNKG
jgi:hypothetical protein